MGPWSRRARVAVLAALADLTAYNAYQVLHSPTRWPDFAYFYSFARAGLIYGDPRIYEPSIQRAAVDVLFRGSPLLVVVNPPPFAWLLTPLMLIPYPLALWIWTTSMIAALAISALFLAPRERFWQVLFTASWLGFLPAYLLVVSAPLAPLVVLSLVLVWKLIGNKHEVAAGVVLAIGLLKPTLAILVPFALLAAGHRRLFVSWLVAAAVFAIASAAALGVSGIKSYIALSTSFAANPYYLRWSLVPILGDGIVWIIAVVLLTAATMLVAWRLRHHGVELVIAVGVMGSVLINHHMTPGDLMMLLAPIWLLLRSQSGPLRNGLLGLTWVAGWLALIFPALALAAAAAMPIALFVRSFRPRSRLQGVTSESPA
ncbi:MAG: glycosyltransferase family 87 protein [Candidatus Dormibacteraceae bacterium]